MNYIFRPTQPIPCRPCYTEQKNLIKSHHFCLKVLTAMYELQSGNSLYNGGIKSKDITRYMQEKFDLDGDVKTQVHISLQQSLAYGFITKESGKYKLVGPMAKVIQEPQDSEERFNEIDRVVKIFWNTRKFTTPANLQGKLSGKESPITVLPEDEETVSCSDSCSPFRKSRKHSRRRRRRSRSHSRTRSNSKSYSRSRSGSRSKTRSKTHFKPSSKSRTPSKSVISNFQLTDSESRKSSSGDLKRHSRRRKRKVRSCSLRDSCRGKSKSRSRSRSRRVRKNRGRGGGGGKGKRKVLNSSSALLLEAGGIDLSDPDCTCN